MVERTLIEKVNGKNMIVGFEPTIPVPVTFDPVTHEPNGSIQRAVLLTEPNGSISDAVIMDVTLVKGGIKIPFYYEFTFTIISDTGGMPAGVTNPERAQTKMAETDVLAKGDLTQALFPWFYDKNGALIDKSYRPPLLVNFASDTGD
jgi:hypothetical protein